MFKKPAPRLKFWLLCLALFIGVESLLRLTLTGWLALDRPDLLAPALALFPLGLVQDMAMAAVLGLPFILGLLVWPGLWRRKLARGAAHGVLITMAAALVFISVSELFFWNEFGGRFDSIAVNYLIFPREVIGNIRESFDLGLILTAVFMLSVVVYLALRKPLIRALDSPPVAGERQRAFGLAAIVGLIAAPVLYLAPFDLDEHREVNEVAANGLHSFLRAALNNDARYVGLYPVMTEEEALATARRLVRQDNSKAIDTGSELSVLRHVDNGNSPNKLNVVLVIEETFGSTFVDGLDYDRLDPRFEKPVVEIISPNLIRLAADGLFFTNIYATGSRTVRALEAILTSFPPIPGISTARRPGSVGMNSLAYILRQQGYRTGFLYGGRALFDNMGTFWSTTGFEDVWEQGDIEDQGFTTAWGVADEYLFAEALKRLDQHADGKTPFLLSLLTVSNHRPYTYPPGRIDKDPAAKRQENATTYADWAFGQFMELAKTRPWFDNTVFIFIGDHGPRLSGSAVVPVPNYRVPLLFYAPKHIKPARREVIGSSMDFIPTLLGLLGISYDSPFFGLDLMRVRKGEGRAVMEHNFSVAYADGENVAILSPGLVTRGYTMQVGNYPLIPRANGADPEVLNKAIGLYQTAHKMFYGQKYHSLQKQFSQPEN
ncbi:MAG: sulfatase-like hydrolase/transferase [Rhodospirillales bacterium]|nr:sulfatase-like hydrolase/transferase [Rhodospirillales bacterium]